jgi:AAA ATPase domain
MATNPFRPTFGTTPPLLVGRDDQVEAFSSSLLEGPGSPGRATVYTGARGVGKTVMLNTAEDSARSHGWLIVSETATPGLIDRITQEQLPKLKQVLNGPQKNSRRFTGVSAAGISANWEPELENQTSEGLRSKLTEVALLAGSNDTGILITVDELHGGPISELREFTTVLQHCFREELPVAFVGAGLPSAVSSLLNDSVLTFLRRADRYLLGAVALDEVRDALRLPIEESGRSITDQALDAATAATRGYPFMIQLLGHQVWRQSPTESVISLDQVERGIATARRRLGQLVVEPSLQDLSETDRTFLLAMAHDGGPSSMKTIAERMGVDATYAGQYRLRLLEAEVIISSSYGKVDFALPSMRDYLREHGVLEAQGE